MNIYVIIISIAFLIIALVTIFTSTYYINKRTCHIPKIIWTYWHDKEYDSFLTKNFQEWRDKMGGYGWTINILGPEDFPDTVPSTLYKFDHPHQADWIRLYKLKYEGGLWLDASIIINEPDKLEIMYQQAVKDKRDLVVFKTKLHETHGKLPIIENWFIMAPINSNFISLWFEEFNTAIGISFQEYQNTVSHIDAQKIGNNLYLTQHICAQKILQENPDLIHHIRTYDSSENMFKLQADCNWDSACVVEKVENGQMDNIPFVKLRGAERKYLNR